MSNFRVGQKVAAICDLVGDVLKGQVLTISRIETGHFRAYDGEDQFVSLNFFDVLPRDDYSGFDARFFRPVTTRKTDISIFKAMLNPSKHYNEQDTSALTRLLSHEDRP
jgi:hypothetical protein